MDIFKENVLKIVDGKRLYGNKFKVLQVDDHETSEEIFLLTKLTIDKLEMVLMFVEGLLENRLNLNELSFYVTCMFDIYEVEKSDEDNLTINTSQESALGDIEVSDVNVYSANIHSIRSRYGKYKNLIIQSNLLRDNISLGDRAYRILHYHKDKFDIVMEKEQEGKDNKRFIETEYEHYKIIKTEMLQIKISVLQILSDKENSMFFESDLFLSKINEIKFKLDLESHYQTIDFTKWSWIGDNQIDVGGIKYAKI